MKPITKILKLSNNALLEKVWASDSSIYTILKNSESLSSARIEVFKYLNHKETHYFDAEYPEANYHIIERNLAKECIRILSNIFLSENEKATSFSAFSVLYELARGNKEPLQLISKGFLSEFVYLFRGINARFDLMFENEKNHLGTIYISARPKRLKYYSKKVSSGYSRFKRGIDQDISKKRDEMRTEILNYFGSTDKSDWFDYQWHLSHIISKIETLLSLVYLEEDEIAGLKLAKEAKIPFQITPYYLSLFNKTGKTFFDRAIRAQVLPSEAYCKKIIKNKKYGLDHDFMDEKSTSPIPGITRRYPQIVILKPYDSCPQICVYCQRNWEIKGIKHASFSKNKMENAIQWIKDHNEIHEILVTGGDPLTLGDEKIKWLFDQLASIDHIERIRIGTRTLVTVPCRFTKNLISILESYHEWGKREIAIITHFEHSMEITPEVIDAVKLIKRAGMNIYNQQVFTYFNSLRYESSFLRANLKISGIDPYYGFNTKGKEETIDFRVPIARIEQERKEEARLLPGLVRTDEPVFNVPRLGKSHLRAGQDHELVMILPDGKRVYRFYPWDSRLSFENDYLYTDVPIYDYLLRLYKDKENVDVYESIWYYF